MDVKGSGQEKTMGSSNGGMFSSIDLVSDFGATTTVTTKATSSTLFALPATTGGANQILQTDGSGNTFWGTGAGSGSSSGLSSVGITFPTLFNVSGSPLTANGNITVSYSGTALPITSGGTGSTTATGSGAVVLANSPTLVTPTIGVALGTSLYLSSLTVNQAVITDGSNNLVSYPFTTTPTASALVQRDSSGNVFGSTFVATNRIYGTGFNSTVATGTAPLIVASTTNVANLNASTVNGVGFASPSNNTAVHLDGSGQFVSVANSGSGSNVMTVSPSLVTPALGVAGATSLTLTNPLAVTSGGTGVTTSSGSGANVLATGATLTSPVFVTPTLGVAAATSLTLTNPLPTAYGGTGTSTGTGTGAVVYANAPTLTTPTLGVATGTSLTLSTPLGTASGGVGTTSTTGTGANVFATGCTLVTPGIGAATGTSLVLSGALTRVVDTFTRVGGTVGSGGSLQIPINCSATYKCVEIYFNATFSSTGADLSIGYDTVSNFSEFYAVFTKVGGGVATDSTNVICKSIENTTNGCSMVIRYMSSSSTNRAWLDVKGGYCWTAVGNTRVEASAHHVGDITNLGLYTSAGGFDYSYFIKKYT